jgi:hypothetical protein
MGFDRDSDDIKTRLEFMQEVVSGLLSYRDASVPVPCGKGVAHQRTCEKVGADVQKVCSLVEQSPTVCLPRSHCRMCYQELHKQLMIKTGCRGCGNGKGLQLHLSDRDADGKPMESCYNKWHRLYGRK